MKKALYIVGGLLLLFIILQLTQFHSDIPLSDLKARYAPPTL